VVVKAAEREARQARFRDELAYAGSAHPVQALEEPECRAGVHLFVPTFDAQAERLGGKDQHDGVIVRHEAGES
jgi:hypothetical protein